MSSGEKQTVLVVDDVPENIDVLAGILKADYRVKAATSGARALSIAMGANAPDIILLDVMMPEMDGYEVCRRLKGDPATARIPVIFVTARSETEDETHGLEVGGVDYITKPVKPAIVRQRVKNHLALYDQARHLEDLVKERTREVTETRLEVINRLGRAAEYKDNETGMHVVRMSQYARLLALASGMDVDAAELLCQAAPMHDIGKIGIPDHILGKPGRFEPHEWEEMKRHVEYGAEIIGDHHSAILKMAKIVVLTHHEKWDGSGYPAGLAGEDIPVEGRITAIADVFDALTSVRPYKKAWSVEDAVQLIRDEKGRHFDPQLVDHFLSILPQILEVKEQFAEPGQG